MNFPFSGLSPLSTKKFRTLSPSPQVTQFLEDPIPSPSPPKVGVPTM